MVTKKAPASKTVPAGKQAQLGKKVAPKKRITEKTIRKRAEEIYLRRMKEGIPGDADSDWRQAEEELRKP